MWGAAKMSLKIRLSLLQILITSFALGLSGCATEGDDQEGLLSVAPDGWTQIILDNNYAWQFKVTVDEIGHYEVSWSPCTFNKAWGVADAKDWREIVRALNKANKKSMREDEKCFKVSQATSNDSRRLGHFEGDVIVKSSRGTRTLLTSRNGEVCTRLEDQDLSKKIYEVANRIVVQASKEDCPPSLQ